MSGRKREEFITKQVSYILDALEKFSALRELLNIVVAIDTTGSMGETITTIKQHMAFLQRVCTMYGINLIFIDFNDMEEHKWSSNEPLIVITKNAAEIRRAHGGFGNGGECAGLAISVAEKFNASAIIVITDDNFHEGNGLVKCEEEIISACELSPFKEATGVLVVEVGCNTNFRSVEGFKVQQIGRNKLDDIISIISLAITAHEFDICAENAAELAKEFSSMIKTHGQHLLTPVFAQSILLKFDEYRLKFPEVQLLVSEIGTLKQTNKFPGLDIVLNQKVVNEEMAERNVGDLMPRFVSLIKLTPSYINAAFASGDKAKIESVIKLILEMKIVESTSGIPVKNFKIEHALSMIVRSYKLKGRFELIVALMVVMQEVESDEQQIIHQAAVDYLITTKSSNRINPTDPANMSWTFLTIALAAADYLNDEELAFVTAGINKCNKNSLKTTPFVLKMLSHSPVSIDQFDETQCTKCKFCYPSAHCLRVDKSGKWIQSRICTFCETTNDKDIVESSRCINKNDPHAARCAGCEIIYITMGLSGVQKPKCFVCRTGCLTRPPVYICKCGNSSYTNECVLCLNGVSVDVITPVTVTLVDDNIAQRAENYAEFLEAIVEKLKIDQPDRSCYVCGNSGIKACTRFGCKAYTCIGCLQWETITPGHTVEKGTIFCVCGAQIDKNVINSNPAVIELLARYELPKLEICMKIPGKGRVCKDCLGIHDLQLAACGEDDDNREYTCDKCAQPVLPGDIFHCPGCNAPIESTGGCPHFHCPQCDTHFCKFCTSLGSMNGSTIYTDHIYPKHRCNGCYDWSETLIDGFCKDCSN